MLLSKTKTVVALSLVACMNLYSQANGENSNQAPATSAGGGGQLN
jgi:hypothetical protein